MSHSSIAERLRRFSQEHVLRWWPELNSAQQQELTAQLDAVDLPWLEAQRTTGESSQAEPVAAKAARARPPADLVRLPASGVDETKWTKARRTGEELLRAGRVATVLVAGGEATRLGFEYPKGMYPIGAVSGRTLFELLTAQILARAQRAGRPIPLYVMTSSATHERTESYFRERKFLGLDPNDVRFFRQGNLPAVDRETGRLLMADKHRLALNPDGHGGLLSALVEQQLLDDMRQRGVEYLYYFQVDNPLARVCDPAFLGFHALHESEVSTKVVAKLSAEEKMGVVVDIDERAQIIEYSDLPSDLAQQRDETGNLNFWAGNTAIHVFSRAFLDRLVQERIELPVHRAIKKVPHLDEMGKLVAPTTENAIKYERFIFDVLPLASRALVVEASRAEEFCPLKNKTGEFSPTHVQQNMTQLHADWLRAAGLTVPEGLPVEVDPLYALDAEELSAKVDRSIEVDRPLFLN